MRLSGPFAELFAAFSRINRAAYHNDALVSCPVLSRAPNYGDILNRYINGTPSSRRGVLFFARGISRYLLTNFGHLAFLAFVRLALWKTGWQSPLQSPLQSPPAPQQGRPSAHSRLVIIDTYAVIPRLLESGKFAEAYLPDLAETARKAGHSVVHFYRLYGSRNPLHLMKALPVLQANGPGLIDALLLRGADWFLLVWHVVRYPFALLALVRSLADAPAGSPEWAIRNALVDTFGQCVVNGEALRLAARRLAEQLPAVDDVEPDEQDTQKQNANPREVGAQKTPANCPLIISWFENQTMNKCWYRGLWQARNEGAPRFRTLGAQLLVWPEALLNNHIDMREAEHGLLPDTILVNGPYFCPETPAEDNEPLVSPASLELPPQKMPCLSPEPQILAGPALRYRALFNAEETIGKLTEGDEKPLLVLLSYHPAETRRVLALVQPLATARPDAVAYKFHPATTVRDYAGLLPTHPQVVSGNLYDALAKAGAVIGSGSGALAEAAALGVATLAIVSEENGANACESPLPCAENKAREVPLNYLPDFGKGVLWDAVSCADEIAPCLLRLREAAQARDFAQTVVRFRDLLFTRPDEKAVLAAFELAGENG